MWRTAGDTYLGLIRLGSEHGWWEHRATEEDDRVSHESEARITVTFRQVKSLDLTLFT
jgi:hypothetical protein